MTWRAQIDDRGAVTRYKDTDSGETISAKEYERLQQMQVGRPAALPQMTATPGVPMAVTDGGGFTSAGGGFVGPGGSPLMVPTAPQMVSQPAGGALPAGGTGMMPGAAQPGAGGQPFAAPGSGMPAGAAPGAEGSSPLIQPGAQLLNGATAPSTAMPMSQAPSQPPTAGQAMQGKNLRMEGIPHHQNGTSIGYKSHGFLDATSIAILLPTLVLLALIIAAAHKKRLFPWQTIRTFNPPSGLITPREYERTYLCPPNLRRHGRLGKRNPAATWTEQDGIVLPFGFLARTHLPVTIPLGRLPNKNMFIVAPSGSGKTTLMRAVMKALLAKPCVIIALEAKANDPNLDEKREGFKYTVLPEAQQAGFQTLYFNPLDADSVHWNPLDLDPITFSSSIVTDVNSLPPEEQHWAERDHGYISGLATLLKWGAVQVSGEDENGLAAEVQPLPCNPRGLMRLVNNRRNIVESLRRLKSNPNVDAAELSELTQMLSSIIRTDTEWDKNIQGIRGRLRMFKNPNVLRVTERSNIDMRSAMHTPTVLIFGAPASLGPDAESLASCFVYQLQQALHTRYGTASVLPLFAFFDEYQTLNIDLAGRLSAIVRGANGGLTVILQNISQIAGRANSGGDPTAPGGSELKTIFSNSSIRVCLHNADESTAKFFSDEIGKHAIIVPGISDHYDAKGFGIFPSTWNRIHSQQVVARIDADSIKRMEKHHALVYLSPAGDNEFGETKPFMVDLRGIEEIARLHLLHNVAGRMNPPGGPGSQPGGGYGGGPFNGQSGPVGPGNGGVGQDAVVAFTGGVPANGGGVVNQTCPHCGHAPGKGKFCIECGRPLPGAAGSPPPGPGAQSGLPSFVQPGAQIGTQTAGQPVVDVQDGLLPVGVAEVAPSFQQPVPVEQQPLMASAQVHGQILPPFARAIGQVPPRGIQEIDPLPVTAPVAPVGRGMPPGVPMPTEPSQAAAPQFAGSRFGNPDASGIAPVRPTAPPPPPAPPPQPMQPKREHREPPVQQRPPVTSLSPDLSRLGIPQPGRPAPEQHQGQHAQQQKPQSGGVEF